MKRKSAMAIAMAMAIAVSTLEVGTGGLASAGTGDVVEFGLATGTTPIDIAAGPDGNLWFSEQGGGPPPPAIGRITATGNISEFPVPDARGIASGPDGNLWFICRGNVQDSVGRITPAGAVTMFPLPAASDFGDSVDGIAPGPDGNVWFTEGSGTGAIGRITPTGTITEFALAAGFNEPADIVTGPEGEMWFTEFASAKVGRITTDGVFLSEFDAGVANPNHIVAGQDGNLWYTGDQAVVRMTTAGVTTVFSAPGRFPNGIAAGPDGALWFTETATTGDLIGRLSTGGTLSEFAITTPAAGVMDIAPGSDGRMWFTEADANSIGAVTVGALAVSLAPSVVAFGNQQVQTMSAPRTVTLTNTGNGPLTITSVTTTAEFNQASSTCPLSPATLPVGSHCDVTVTFIPSVAGARTGSITIVDNATGSPRVVQLSGTGMTPSTDGAVYVALGDSITSGEGGGAYRRPGSGLQPGELERCHRSANGYPALLGALHSGLGTPDIQACSGANLTTIVSGHGETLTGTPLTSGPFPTQSQLDALGPSTRLVTLTAGINDLRPDLLAGVCMFADPCGPGLELLYGVKQKIAALEPTLTGLYHTIRVRAPNASVFVLGYPQMFCKNKAYIADPATTAVLQVLAGRSGFPSMLDQQGVITATNANYLRDRIADLNGVIADAADAAGVDFVSDDNVFAGHQLCDKNPWVNGIKLDITDPALLSEPFAAHAIHEAFHPNKLGYFKLEALLEEVHAASFPPNRAPHIVAPTPAAPTFGLLSTVQTRVTNALAVQLQGAGFTPGSLVHLLLFSTPVSLGDVAATADGNVQATVTLPAGVPTGEHTIVMQGTGTNGLARTLSAPVMIVPSGCPGFENDARPQLAGTAGPDHLSGTALSEIICGLGGPDEISGRGGADLVVGGEGNDNLYGRDGDDQILGGPGDDKLEGGSGTDLLDGGAGHDRCDGGKGHDTALNCEQRRRVP